MAIFHDDTGCGGACFIASENSEDNGTGVYGKVVQTSNFPGAVTKTTTTKYTQWALADIVNAAKPWITTLYSERTVEAGAETRRELACFNSATGFLDRHRLLRNAASPGAADLLTVYQPSALGDVSFVQSYGGDQQPNLPLTHSCTDSLSTLSPWYKVENHYLTPVDGGVAMYAGGALVWSRYCDRATGGPLGFKVLDRTIDRFTGAVTATRDSAGITTTYDYEATPLRLKSVTTAGGATTSYEYNPRTPSKNPHVIATVRDAEGVVATNTYEYDLLGRMRRSSSTLPNGNVAVVQTNYDALGRAGSTTEPVERNAHPFSDVTGPSTSFTYDAFGRPTSVLAPDASRTTFDYTGVRRKVRQSTVETVTGGKIAPVTELYDPEGRVAAVMEKSGPNGEDVTTSYTYDVAGNLTRVVTTSPAGVTQTRTFAYDGRGFLTAETHPENVTTDPVTRQPQPGSDRIAFEYDARGHLTKKDAFGTAFDLTFTYDSAERLVKVFGPGSSLLKKFDFGTSGALNGRLVAATRINYPTQAGESTIRVKESYGYDTAGRRDSQKTEIEELTIANDAEGAGTPLVQPITQKVAYNALDRVRQLEYPVCTFCGLNAPGGRTVDFTYRHGALDAISGFVSSTTYHPNGLWATRQRLNETVDQQLYDTTTGMPRPSRLEVYGITKCAGITQEPRDVTVAEGQPATLSVIASPGATFIWYQGVRGDTTRPVPNGTASALTLSGLTQTTSYWCRVTAGCVADSVTATVTVCTAARVVEPAADVNTAERHTVGESLTFTVVANGNSVSYVWTKTRMTTPPGSPVIVSTAGPSMTWIVEEGTWAIDVTATSVCNGVITSAARRVATITGANCTLALRDPFPPTIEISANFPIVYFDAGLTDNTGWDWKTEKDQFTFKWWVNGHLQATRVGDSTFDTPIQGGLALAVEIRYSGPRCASSITLRRETYVFQRDNCPAPPLSVDQKTISPSSPSSTFTASSPWPTVTYTWYRGDTGNTRFKVGEGKALTVARNAAATYWVRAVSECGTYADSETLTVTTAACTPVRFLRHPQGAELVLGGTHTLSFETGTTPEVTAVTWYEGADVQTGTVIGQGREHVVQPQRTAQYFAVVDTAACGRFESAAATVRVTSCNAITVTTSPNSVTVPIDTSTSLSIAATAAYPLQYQWYQGDAGDVSKPQPAGAAITVRPAESTRYWVRVSIPGGCAIDRVVTVTVCKPLTITNHPIGAVSIPGFKRWIGVETTGTAVSFQWYQRQVKNGPWTLMNGGTSRYVLVAPLLTTEYKVVVSSACGTSGSVESHPARVSLPPNVPQLTGGLVTKGTVKTMNATTDASFPAYQWYRGSEPIAGQVSATFTTPPLDADVTYWARVWSGDAWADTNTAAFTVCQPRQVSVSQPSKLSGAEVTLSVQGAGGNEVYEWYLGNSGNTSTPIGVPSATATQLKVSPVVTTSYWLRTRRAECNADTPAITIVPCLPRINTQPLSRMINPGESTTLSVAAAGNLPLSYQWYIGAAGVTANPVPNSNTATLPIGPLTADTTYWVAVSSPAASCTSSTTTNSAAATISVCKVPVINAHPVSATSTTGAPVQLSVTASATDVQYQWYSGASGVTASPITTNGTGPMVTVIPQQTTDYWVRVSGRCGTPKDSTAAKVSIAPVITGQPAGGLVSKNDTRRLSVTVSGLQLKYQWYQGAGTAAPLSGQTSSYFDTPQITSDVTYWVRVWSGVLPVDSNAAALTVLQPRAVAVSQPSVVSGSAVTLTLNGSSAAETYTWYRGVSGSVANPLGSGTSIVVNPLETTSYWVRTKNGTAQADSATATVYVCKPAIATQPAGKYLMPGQSHTLAVAATGTSPSYQWYYGSSGDTANPVPGATQAALPVSPAATTSYWVRVSSPITGCTSANSYANSAAAVVTVCVKPAISRQPMSNVVENTSSVTLDVLASGDNLSYQWYEGTAGVTTKPVGTNKFSLTVIPGTTRSYWVRVSGTCGTVDSAVALISVLPTFTTHPADATLCAGQNAAFNVVATGDPATLSYQWMRLVSGASTPEPIGGNAVSVTVPATATMQVWCTAKSANSGWVASNCATLTAVAGPAIVGTSKTRRAGGSYTLYVDVIQDPEHEVTYEWYEGQPGDTRFLIGNSYYVNVVPSTTPAYYWVRVTSDAGCASTATVTTP